jgi:hypothetical protein
MPLKLNKEWHLAHPMPENATMAQRIKWHLEHARVCKCRDIPDSIKKELRKRKSSGVTPDS